jgi:hypothetical protein
MPLALAQIKAVTGVVMRLQVVHHNRNQIVSVNEWSIKTRDPGPAGHSGRSSVMRIVPIFCLAVAGLFLAACEHAPEHVAIQHQYVGADVTTYGGSPLSSITGNIVHRQKGQPQARCAVVKYDPYARPYCDAVKYIR